MKAALRGRDFATQVQMLAPDRGAGRGDAGADVHAAAAEGVRAGGGRLPYGEQIQRSFGGYDISNVVAHNGAAAEHAAGAMGASAYATGNDVVLGKGGTDLHTVAHEAAHVVQQRAGVSLSGGVGQAGDPYERHADAVADLVVQGKSAEGLLGQMAGGGGATGIQMKGGDEESAKGAAAGASLTNEAMDQVHTSRAPRDIDAPCTDSLATDAFQLETRRPEDVIQDTARAYENAVQAHLRRAKGEVDNFTRFVFAQKPSSPQNALAAVAAGVVTGLTGGLAAMPVAAALLTPAVRSALTNIAAAETRGVGPDDNGYYLATQLNAMADAVNSAYNVVPEVQHAVVQQFRSGYLSRYVKGLSDAHPGSISGGAGRYLAWLDDEAARYRDMAKGVAPEPYKQALFGAWVDAHLATAPGGHANDNKAVPTSGYIELHFVSEFDLGHPRRRDTFPLAVGATRVLRAFAVAPAGEAAVEYLKTLRGEADIWRMPMTKRITVLNANTMSLANPELDFTVDGKGAIVAVYRTPGRDWESRGPWIGFPVATGLLEGRNA